MPAPAGSWACAFLGAVAFFLMCGVYELQGPRMGWWLWPRNTDGVVKDGCAIWQGGELGDDDRGLTASPHVLAALGERVHGAPILAPYFHMAIGWGITAARVLLGAGRPIAVGLVGPAIALVTWDPAFRLVGAAFGVDTIAAATALMALTLALLSSPARRSAARRSPDVLLFSIPALNHAFFVHNAMLSPAGAAAIPSDHKLLIACVSAAALAFYGRAAGLVGGGDGADKPPLASLESLSDGRPSLRREETPDWLNSAFDAVQSLPRRLSMQSGVVASKTPSSYTTIGQAPSFLDRLQKDAHASEMDYSNTAPSFFVALSAVQPPVAAAVAWAIGVPPSLALLPIASHAAMFVISHYLLKTDKYFDITGESTFFPLILYSHYTLAGESASGRQRLVTLLALAWCTRLGIFLGWRIFARGSDWRFEKLMRGAAYNAFGWVRARARRSDESPPPPSLTPLPTPPSGVPGLWIFLQGFCLWLAHAAPPAAAWAPSPPSTLWASSSSPPASRSNGRPTCRRRDGTRSSRRAPSASGSRRGCGRGAATQTSSARASCGSASRSSPRAASTAASTPCCASSLRCGRPSSSSSPRSCCWRSESTPSLAATPSTRRTRRPPPSSSCGRPRRRRRRRRR